MDDLTRRLSDEQAVEVGGPRPELAELRARLEEVGVVFVRFIGTRGGTDLAVRVDRPASDWSSADLVGGSGIVHLEGSLTLNGDRVRCVADLDAATLKGTGRLIAGQPAGTAG